MNQVNLKNNKKIVGLVLIITSIIFLITLVVLGIYFYIVVFSSLRLPLKNKTHYFKNGMIQEYNENRVFTYDRAMVKITRITRDEYKLKEQINAFYDYIYDLYYSIEIIFISKGVEVKAETFCCYPKTTNFSYRPRYCFDLKINDRIYKNGLCIENYGSLWPRIYL